MRTYQFNWEWLSTTVNMMAISVGEDLKERREMPYPDHHEQAIRRSLDKALHSLRDARNAISAACDRVDEQREEAHAIAEDCDIELPF